MNWPNGTPSTSKVQVASRGSRYDLMLEQCQERGLKTLLCGHHADDQVGKSTNRVIALVSLSSIIM